MAKVVEVEILRTCADLGEVRVGPGSNGPFLNIGRLSHEICNATLLIISKKRIQAHECSGSHLMHDLGRSPLVSSELVTFQES
jgi:hypothetical protein